MAIWISSSVILFSRSGPAQVIMTIGISVYSLHCPSAALGLYFITQLCVCVCVMAAGTLPEMQEMCRVIAAFDTLVGIGFSADNGEIESLHLIRCAISDILMMLFMKHGISKCVFLFYLAGVCADIVLHTHMKKHSTGRNLVITVKLYKVCVSS